MQLTEFIKQERKTIIREWIQFASSLLPWAQSLSKKELRDHAEELLDAVVADMCAPQSSIQQSKKSKGGAGGGRLAAVGHAHASQRWQSGLNLNQLVAEYRALRASILRLWERAQHQEDDEVTRFNESIDESLIEATARYSEILDRMREQFLGILGHDLRNPLGAIIMGATLLTQSESLEDKQVRVAQRILDSASRMDRMVNDLLDLTRTRLGSGIPVEPKRMNLGTVCKLIVAEVQAIHPDRHVSLKTKGSLLGTWDSDRLAQVVANLVMNALDYGSKTGTVSVFAKGEGSNVVLQVHNRGSAITEAAMKKIFEPMVRQPTHRAGTNATGLGLGLYIAREVVTAHHGTIRVLSTRKAGTTFIVELPRHARAKVAARKRSKRHEQTKASTSR